MARQAVAERARRATINYAEGEREATDEEAHCPRKPGARRCPLPRHRTRSGDRDAGRAHQPRGARPGHPARGRAPDTYPPLSLTENCETTTATRCDASEGHHRPR